MINPFLSNNDGLLFRKNYQVIAKPTSPPSLAPHSSGKIEFLQSRNPFVGSTALQHPLSHSRSVSPATVPLNHSRVTLGKSRIGDEGWKRDFQSKERQKLQVYGAEGLRYNAYPEYSPRQPANDYYGYSKPENLYKPPPPREKTLPQPAVPHYPPLERNQQQFDSGKLKKTKEVFLDDVNESEMMGSKAWGRFGAQVDKINEEDSGRQSNLKDMFSSEYGDKFKRSLGYGSVYAQEMGESKHGHPKQAERRQQRFYESRGHQNWRGSPLVESTVRRMEVIAPGSISFQGKMYQRVPL